MQTMDVECRGRVNRRDVVMRKRKDEKNIFGERKVVAAAVVGASFLRGWVVVSVDGTKWSPRNPEIQNLELDWAGLGWQVRSGDRKAAEKTWACL